MLENYIPAGVLSKMRTSALSSPIEIAAKRIYEHFRLSGLPFFREYTDHSFHHSVDVFRSACDMVTESAFHALSSDDLNILMLSCLTHDAGLHITEDMFLALTDSANSCIYIPDFDKKAWPELWTEFVAEAQRFNEKKLVSLFGDAKPVREPPRSALELSQRDKLLIGEFLRKHHPRFAHEFVLGHTPDAKNNNYEFPELELATRDIVGIIARSHGLGLRDTFSYLEKYYNLRDFNRIHIIYLMVLIRIADYLQIQSARAPSLLKNYTP